MPNIIVQAIRYLLLVGHPSAPESGSFCSGGLHLHGIIIFTLAWASWGAHLIITHHRSIVIIPTAVG